MLTPKAGTDVTAILSGNLRDLGGLTVRRILPAPGLGPVGPFVFFDHFGPAAFGPGQGLDVRPHPHINLATVTYLFEGAIVHRDSLGYEQAIRPGALNWMNAGRGIVHSERTGSEDRRTGGRIHGIQAWVALPRNEEESAPTFEHVAAADLPTLERPGVRVHVIAGNIYGQRAPIRTKSPLFYAELRLGPGAEWPLPHGAASGPRSAALYVVAGRVGIGADVVGPGQMAVLDAASSLPLRGLEAAHAMLLGGEALDGERHIWWNFVSSSRDRIERAKEDWRQGRFGKVPGDEVEFIPLPDR